MFTDWAEDRSMDYFDVITDMKKRIQVEIECGKRNFAIYPFGVGG